MFAVLCGNDSCGGVVAAVVLPVIIVLIMAMVMVMVVVVVVAMVLMGFVVVVAGDTFVRVLEAKQEPHEHHVKVRFVDEYAHQKWNVGSANVL
jgi:hypothetical protein